MAILHIGTSLIYAFCITNITSYINTNSVIVTICLAFLTIAGKLVNLSRVRTRLFLSQAIQLVWDWLRLPDHCHLH